ncbi:hypothetical protein H8B02_17400 [Bradyrhizobium sp. Pear77]|uniref:hypothetical protein n=1 Tax=Bradyrhizobium altum TaxID=1571202 RepID=UPI001E47F595|nr:hypothetical protein [Bradyrhizobium altum]MCC8955155.1 hypothetical protein [Bradyrhizobium altum]
MIALVATLLAPLATGTWRMHGTYWKPLSSEDRTKIAELIATDDCRTLRPMGNALGTCEILRTELDNNGSWTPGDTWQSYLTRNLTLMVVTFGFAFSIAYAASRAIRSLHGFA